MLRSFVLVLVLSVVAGPSVPLCQFRCTPPAATVGHCHHADAATSVLSSKDECDRGLLEPAALVNEIVRRGISDRHVASTLIVARHHVVASASDPDFSYFRLAKRSLTTRPPTTTLRI